MNMREQETHELSEQLHVSRRQLLQGVAMAAGGAAIVVAAVRPAEAKMAQKAAGYQATPKDGQSCANCALFKAPSSCTLVDGTVSPDGWCRFYSKKS
jgi:high potential iron-sulfur protein